MTNYVYILYVNGFSSTVRMSPRLRQCRRSLDLPPGRFRVSLVCVPGHVLGNVMADELTRSNALLLESFSIELGMSLASFNLAIMLKFFRDANLYSG